MSLICLCLLMIAQHIHSSILSSSNITQCFNSANNCTQQITLTFTLENNQLAGAESTQLTYTNFTDANNNVYQLNSPLTLSLAKSQVHTKYPLQYIMDVPTTVTEQVIPQDWPLCSEGSTYNGKILSNSTCGLQTTALGVFVPYSGGFCCTCPLLAILTGISSTVTRNTCTAFGKTQAAHCLRFSSSFYSVYSISQFMTDFNVTLTLGFNNGTNQNITTILSPSNRIANNGILFSQIVGSFAPTSPPTDLQSKFLLRPKPIINTNQSASVSTNWLLIDNSAITFDGSECNKIGVSYSAFQNQNNACQSIAGTCLGNQIPDLIASDSLRISNRLSAQWLLMKQGNFTGIQSSSNITQLDSIFTADYTTVVSVTLNASNFKFISNLGNATILDLKISDFEAQTSIGNLSLTLMNTGFNTALFSVSVNCTANVQRVPAQMITLTASAVQPISFFIYALSSNNILNSCSVVVMNSNGNLVVTKSVQFNSTQTQTKLANTTSSGTFFYGNSSDTPVNASVVYVMTPDFVCQDLCANFATSFCLLLNKCTSQLTHVFYLAGIGLGCVLTLLGVFLFFCRGK